VLLVIHDEEKKAVIDTILGTAKSGESGMFGDGKIFVSPIEEVYTISRGGKGL
jgi:nitrogen regulatory protein PII 1